MKLGQKIKALIIVALMMASYSLVALPATANAQLFSGSKEEACNGASLDDNGSCDGGGAQVEVQSVTSKAIQMFSFVIAVIAVIMIIIGGLKYITSSGDPSSVNGAKNTILYAIVGLVIAAMAQVIVRFVVNKVQI